MDFGHNSVIAANPNFVKIKSTIVPTTRVGRLTNGSDWLWPWHDIEEVMAERVRKSKRIQQLYLKNEFETMK